MQPAAATLIQALAMCFPCLFSRLATGLVKSSFSFSSDILESEAAFQALNRTFKEKPVKDY